MKEFFKEKWHCFWSRQVYRTLSSYQVKLSIKGKVVADLPLLSVLENKKNGIYDTGWELIIS